MLKRILSGLVTVLLLSAIGFCLSLASPWTKHNAPAHASLGDDYRDLRAPLFGLVVQKKDGAERFRLLSIEEGGDRRSVLAEGDLAKCEKQLLKTLKQRHGTGKINLPLLTLGGKQFWADRFIYCGWRIQENVFTGHHRLLDPDDVRRSWGDFAQCRVAFEESRIRDKIRPASKKLALLVHGLFRSKDSLSEISSALEKAGFDVESVNYPSTQQTTEEHARQLESILNMVTDYETVSFVTHSLGGIVVRQLLARKGAWRKKLRVERLVMIAPPNRGSIVAEMLKDWIAYKLIAGRSGQELTAEVVNKIPEPDCPFAIIAGGTGTDTGLVPFLPGDNDGTVLVKNTHLPSESDFLIVRALHSFLMNQPLTIEATVRFLKEGRFRPAK